MDFEIQETYNESKLCYLIINDYKLTEGSVVCVFSGLVDGGGEEVTWKRIRVSEKTEQSFRLAGKHASYKQLRSKPREVLQSLDSRATKHDALNGMIEIWLTLLHVFKGLM